MRGRQEGQPRLFFTIDVGSRIRGDHPLRDVKKRVDAILRGMSDLFDQAYPNFGRPGIPSEVLLKALLLQALYSIRSEKQLLERIDTDLLFRWFLDLDPADELFDATAYAHNRPRLDEHQIITVFFDAGDQRESLQRSLQRGWDDHRKLRLHKKFPAQGEQGQSAGRFF